MTELRIRPKSNYLHQAGWQELYVLTKHWHSDMKFYEEEINFLRDLVDRYFIWLIRDENIRQVQSTAARLLKAEGQHKEIVKKIDKHLIHLEELMENSFAHDEQKFRDEHAELEDEMTVFLKDFNMVKREVFAIIGHVMEAEKLQHLLMK